jgi:hypothetical protein
MKRFFCCFKKKQKKQSSSYIEYYSNRDNMSDTSITNSLIDALKDDDENIYMDNPIHHGKHTSVVGASDHTNKKLK